MKQLLKNTGIIGLSAILLMVFGTALVLYLVYLTIREHIQTHEHIQVSLS